MKFTAADITAMIDAFGDDVTTDFETMRGIYQAPGKVFDSYNGGIVTTSPTLLLSEIDAALITENSTFITIGAETFQAIEIMPDGAGFSELTLTKDY